MPRPKGSKNKIKKDGTKYNLSEEAKIQRILAPLKTGENSTTLMRYAGCDKCPYKHSCKNYDPNNKYGCEARRRELLNTMLEIGNSGLLLLNKAGLLSSDFEEFRQRLIDEGKNPLQDPMYQKAMNTLIELAKHLQKLNLDKAKMRTIDQVQADKKEVIIVENTDAYEEEIEEEDEDDE